MLNFREWFKDQLIIEAVGYTGRSPAWAALRNKNRLIKKLKADPQLAAELWQEVFARLRAEGWTGNGVHTTKCLRHNFVTYDDEMDMQRNLARGCDKLRERLLLAVTTADLIAGIIDGIMPAQYRQSAHESNKQWVQQKQQEYQGEAQRFLQNKWIPNACPPEFFTIPAGFAA